jgi:hypothetical protein
VSVFRKQVERAWAFLQDIVADGERCPTSLEMPGGSASVSQLAREGRILVEVFSRNFRRVTILQGLYQGKATAAPPLRNGQPQVPYLTVSQEGTRRNGVLIDTGWKPKA